MDIIEIRNLRLRATVGFSPHELDAPQDIVVNLRIGVDARRAGESDEPDDAFNYRTIAKAIISFVEASRFSLVEKLAEEIARLAVLDFKAPHIEVSVHKPGALRKSDSVGIRIARRASDYERNLAFISLGSNINPERNIVAAVERLQPLHDRAAPFAGLSNAAARLPRTSAFSQYGGQDSDAADAGAIQSRRH